MRPSTDVVPPLQDQVVVGGYDSDDEGDLDIEDDHSENEDSDINNSEQLLS